MPEAINEAFGEVGNLMPKLNITGVSLMLDLILLFVGFIVVLIIAGVIAFFVVRALRYNNKVTVWEKINNDWLPTKKDRACQINISDSGDKVFYYSNMKIYRPKPTYQVGWRKYYVAKIGDELVNFGIEDIDAKTRQMKIKIPNQALTLSRVAVGKIIDKRSVDKYEWIKKHIGTILAIVLVMVFGIIIFLWFDKLIALSQVSQQGAIAYNELLRQQANVTRSFNEILMRLEVLQSGGDGLTPVG